MDVYKYMDMYKYIFYIFIYDCLDFFSNPLVVFFRSDVDGAPRTSGFFFGFFLVSPLSVSHWSFKSYQLLNTFL